MYSIGAEYIIAVLYDIINTIKFFVMPCLALSYRIKAN